MKTNYIFQCICGYNLTRFEFFHNIVFLNSHSKAFGRPWGWDVNVMKKNFHPENVYLSLKRFLWISPDLKMELTGCWRFAIKTRSPTFPFLYTSILPEILRHIRRWCISSMKDHRNIRAVKFYDTSSTRSPNKQYPFHSERSDSHTKIFLCISTLWHIRSCHFYVSSFRASFFRHYYVTLYNKHLRI